jgi:hypothetical protein
VRAGRDAREVGSPTPRTTSWATSWTTSRTAHDDQAVAGALRLHPRAVRPGAGPADAAPARQPRRGRGPDRLVHQPTRSGRGHRRSGRRQDRRGPRRAGRAGPSRTISIHLSNPAVGARRPLRRDRHRARRDPGLPQSRPHPTDHRTAGRRDRRTRAGRRAGPGRSAPADRRRAERTPTAHKGRLGQPQPFACALVGQPTLRRRIKLGTFARPRPADRAALRDERHDRRRDQDLPEPPPANSPAAATRSSATTPSRSSTKSAAACPARSTTSPSKPSSPRSPATRASSTKAPPVPPSPKSRQNDQHRATVKTRPTV